MKKTLIALVALSGLAMAAEPITFTTDLSKLMSTAGGIQFGGNDNTGTGTESSAEALADFNTMSSIVTTTNKWYTDKNWSNVDAYGKHTEMQEVEGEMKEVSVNNPRPSIDYGITMITDGPGAATNHCSWIAFAYELDADTLADMAEVNSDLALTFNASVIGGNHNNKGQGVMFNLLSAASGFAPMDMYGNESGTDTAAKDVTLTLSAAKVAELAATGTSQKLIFLMTDTDNVSGTNEAWLIQNMKLTYKGTPEPATATLSLLALAGLAARRRRH